MQQAKEHHEQIQTNDATEAYHQRKLLQRLQMSLQIEFDQHHKRGVQYIKRVRKIVIRIALIRQLNGKHKRAQRRFGNVKLLQKAQMFRQSTSPVRR